MRAFHLSVGGGGLFVLGTAMLATFVGCGTQENGAAEIETVSSPLLQSVGAFYTTAPSYGWCGVPGMPIDGPCHGGYSTNSTGATNTVAHLSTGRYRVLFPGLASGGNVQLGSIGSNVHCNVLGTAPVAGGQTVDVICRAPSGALADSSVAVSYYRDTNVGGVLGAYALVHGIGAVSVANIWNSSGGGVTAIKTGTGAYRVVVPGQSGLLDTVLVTAAGSQAGHCKVSAWSTTATINIDVLCFDFAGNKRDNDFSIAYHRNIRGEPRNTLPTGTQGAFALVNAPGGISAAFSRNTCAAGANSATLLGGVYTEIYHVVTTSHGEVPVLGLVTAVGPTGAYCNLQHLPIQGVVSDSKGFVNCFSPDGQAVVSTQHTSMFMIQDVGGC
jgi:hypothetical protein